MRCPRCRARGARQGADDDADRGSASAYLVIFMIALVAMAGLVLDGGAALAARGQAANIAQQAARAGADAMTAGTLRGGGDPLLNPTAAATAAQAVLAAADVEGQINVSGTRVTVTVHQRKPTVILSAVGVDSVGGTATATAIAIRGTNEGH